MSNHGRLFAFQLVQDKVIVIVQGPGICPEHEWNAYLEFLSFRDLESTTSVRFTDGDLSAAQRQRLSELIGQQTFRRAIVSPSRTRVAMVNALGWRSKGAKAFPPAHLDKALAHAAVDRALTDPFWYAVEELWPELLADHRPLWLASCISQAAEHARQGARSVPA